MLSKLLRKGLFFGVIILFLMALLSFVFTYQVRFTERAVLTTFGKADANDVKSEGLKFKLPWPIQEVTKYDTRARFFQIESETQQTLDDRQIIVKAYCIWNVSDPLNFFRQFSNAGDREIDHYRKAEEIIRAIVRSAVSQTSSFRLDELLAQGAENSKLAALEEKILNDVRAALTTEGVEIQDVGINRIMMPQETTESVFLRMGKSRTRLVKEIESAGEAQAMGIESAARTTASRILDFARVRADEIRSLGDREAAQYVEQMNEYPELAVFLKNLEFMREAMAKRITFVFPTTMPGFGLVRPDALGNLEPGEVPDSGFSKSWGTANRQGPSGAEASGNTVAKRPEGSP